MPPTNSGPLLLAVVLAATGCAFSIDANLAKPDPVRDGALDSSEREEDASQPPAEDAEIEPMDDGGDDGHLDADVEQDAGEDAGCVLPPDDAGPDADVDVEIDSGKPCTHDGECGPDYYCSHSLQLEGRFCAPRCSEVDGCALVEAEISNVISDGAETVYYGTAARRDIFDNPLEPHRVWSLRPESTPVVVRDDFADLPRPVLVAGGYLYVKFATPDRTELARLPLDGSGSVESLAVAGLDGLGAVWHAAGYVYWGYSVAHGELWRVSVEADALPTRVATVPGASWRGGNSTVVLRTQLAEPALVPLMADSLPDLTPSRRVGTELFSRDEGRIIADEKAIYYDWGGIRRELFDSSRPSARLSLGNTQTNPFELFGDGWVYWSVEEEPMPRYRFGRAHRDVPNAGSVLWTTSYKVRSFAVVRRWVVLTDGGHLFVHANPPLPCGANLPCPAPLTCSVRELCE